MLDFSVISLSDKPWIDDLLARSDFRSCEYCFANNFAWQRYYQTKITRYKDFYISCTERSGLTFTFPAGAGDYGDVLREMQKYSESKGQRLCVTSVLPDQMSIFTEVFGGDSFEYTTDEADWDYVYNVSDLVELSGKKYHGKRNHLKKINNYDWDFRLITEADFDDCITFAARSYTDGDKYDDESAVAEQYAINLFFNHYNELGLKGGILRINGETAAFTLGERINSDTLGVHIEKARGDIEGAYPAINNMFLKAETEKGGYLYVNREEDLGIEGLRRAKRSYYPAFMIEKQRVTLKG
ncbi:MAG: DUF2156 domain-containing protein [Huintestinicola sp.]